MRAAARWTERSTCSSQLCSVRSRSPRIIKESDVPRNALQVVVEVVGDPAGKRSDRFHLLGVQELRLKIPLLCRILNQAEHGGPIFQVHGDETCRGLKNLAAFADHTEGD